MTHRALPPKFDDLPLFCTDAELAPAIMGTARAHQWRIIAQFYEGKGLPKIDPLFGGARYRPAVKAFLDNLKGIRDPGMMPAEDGRRPRSEEIELWNTRGKRRRIPKPDPT